MSSMGPRGVAAVTADQPYIGVGSAPGVPTCGFVTPWTPGASVLQGCSMCSLGPEVDMSAVLVIAASVGMLMWAVGVVLVIREWSRSS
jgi:hypothetical protein